MPVIKRKVGKSYSIWVQDDVVARVDRLAEKAGISRNKLMSNMIDLTTKSLERADSFGIVSIAILIRDLEETCRSYVRSWKEDGPGLRKDWEDGEILETTFE